jgi:hypothetical protein
MSLRVFTLVLLVCLAIANVDARSTDRTGTITGIASTDGAGISLDGNAVGDIQGPIHLKLRTIGSRVEGEWSLTVTRLLPDGSTTVAGVLLGTATGGVGGMTPEGYPIGWSEVQLLIREGTEELANVTAGTGTVTVRFSGDDSFNASLSLNY